jgi:hypothetical protein
MKRRVHLAGSMQDVLDRKQYVQWQSSLTTHNLFEGLKVHLLPAFRSTITVMDVMTT